ncbi:MAG: hypothetical protein LBH91_02205 [Prevotellaceae bacterium]|jgi:hypothetical protein|nr:hypothetical protein [Prevotellaceae bacterium]
MERLLGIVVILFFCDFVSYAQNENIDNARLMRVVDRDTVYSFRLFEIDINKKKVYAINPVMNYLDIKGGKPKYKVKVKREQWDGTMKLLSEINLSNYKEVSFDNKDYSIVLFFEGNEDKTFITQIESELMKLKEIIAIIRE